MAYVTSPPSDNEEAKKNEMLNFIDLGYKALILKDPDTVQVTLDRVWESRINTMKHVPDEILLNRLEDLKRSYVVSREKFLIAQGREVSDKPPARPWSINGIDISPPGIKTKTSSQSVRIPPSYFTVSGDKVTLTFPGSLQTVITLREAGEFVCTDKDYLTISKRRGGRTRAGDGVVSLERYYVTFSSHECDA